MKKYVEKKKNDKQLKKPLMDGGQNDASYGSFDPEKREKGGKTNEILLDPATSENLVQWIGERGESNSIYIMEKTNDIATLGFSIKYRLILTDNYRFYLLRCFDSAEDSTVITLIDFFNMLAQSSRLMTVVPVVGTALLLLSILIVSSNTGYGDRRECPHTSKDYDSFFQNSCSQMYYFPGGDDDNYLTEEDSLNCATGCILCQILWLAIFYLYSGIAALKAIKFLYKYFKISSLNAAISDRHLDSKNIAFRDMLTSYDVPQNTMLNSIKHWYLDLNAMIVAAPPSEQLHRVVIASRVLFVFLLASCIGFGVHYWNLFNEQSDSMGEYNNSGCEEIYPVLSNITQDLLSCASDCIDGFFKDDGCECLWSPISDPATVTFWMGLSSNDTYCFNRVQSIFDTEFSLLKWERVDRYLFSAPLIAVFLASSLSVIFGLYLIVKLAPVRISEMDLKMPLESISNLLLEMDGDCLDSKSLRDHFCPISQDVMKEAAYIVMSKDREAAVRHYYNKDDIDTYLATNPQNNPSTGESLTRATKDTDGNVIVTSDPDRQFTINNNRTECMRSWIDTNAHELRRLGVGIFDNKPQDDEGSKDEEHDDYAESVDQHRNYSSAENNRTWV